MYKPQFTTLISYTKKSMLFLSLAMFAACANANTADNDDDMEDDTVSGISRKQHDRSSKSDKDSNTSTETETYTYTQLANNPSDNITSQFTFLSPTEVMWSVSTPNGYYLPIGYGTYNSTNDLIVFNQDQQLNPAWVMNDDVITFSFKFAGNTATARSQTTNTNTFFNNGQEFDLKKDNAPLTLNNGLTGTHWKSSSQEEIELMFVSEREVKLNGESMPYIYTGNKLGISTGDNPFSDEAVVGTVSPNDTEMSISKEGATRTDDQSLHFIRVK